MKTIMCRNLPLTILLLFLAVSVSCSTGMYIKSEAVSDADISGSFTLFLYSEYESIKIAILDIEGDDYTIEMSGSPHNYLSSSGVAAEVAVQSAVKFIYSQRNQWSKILAPDGSLIGYDFRAIHQSFTYGIPDILDVSYQIKDKKVVASVDIKHSIRKNYYRNIHGGD